MLRRHSPVHVGQPGNGSSRRDVRLPHGRAQGGDHSKDSGGQMHEERISNIPRWRRSHPRPHKHARQKDPMKRARDARKKPKAGGILVLGHQGEDPEIATARGYPIPKKGEMISISI